MRIVRCGLLFLVISFPTTARSAESTLDLPSSGVPAVKLPPFEAASRDDVAADWKTLDGMWERRQTIPNGTQIRFEKTIRDHAETLRVYGPDGSLLREQTADLKITHQDKLRVLQWSNATVTEGAGVGEKIADGTSVITFKDGKWVSVVGLARDEPWTVYVEVWTKVPESKQ
ncbi:MAG: hypothetical protein R3C01_03705 [Planctomycetaceae bacterium]